MNWKNKILVGAFLFAFAACGEAAAYGVHPETTGPASAVLAVILGWIASRLIPVPGDAEENSGEQRTAGALRRPAA